MRHYETKTVERTLLQNNDVEISITIARREYGTFILFLRGKKIKEDETFDAVKMSSVPISVEILKELCQETIESHKEKDQEVLHSLETFLTLLNKTNPKKKVGKLLRECLEKLKYEHECNQIFYRHKGNMRFDWIKKVMYVLSPIPEDQINPNVFIRGEFLVSPLGDYSIAFTHRLLVNDNYVTGRSVMKERISDVNDLLSLGRKYLLLLRQQNRITEEDLVKFYEEMKVFCLLQEGRCQEIINRLNARLPI